MTTTAYTTRRSRHRRSPEERAAMEREALQRAREGFSVANEAAIVEGFTNRGIPESDIRPRVNVLTFHAWRALGRQVRKGEKSVRIPTWVPITQDDPETGESKVVGKRPKMAYVFHVSQTDPIATVVVGLTTVRRQGAGRLNPAGTNSSIDGPRTQEPIMESTVPVPIEPQELACNGTSTPAWNPVSTPSTSPSTPASICPAAVYLAGLAPGSRRTMRAALDTIARTATGPRAATVAAFDFPWHQLRHEHTAAIRAALADRYAPSTATKMLAALRGVLRAAWRLGLVDGESYHRAVDVPAVRGDRLPRGRALTAGELRSLFEVCASDSSPAGRRDAALLAVLYGAGLRRSEVVNLDLADYDRDTGALAVRGAKGNRDRLAYLAGGARQALDDWLSVRGNADGPLFVPVTKGKAVRLGDRMSAQAVYGLLRKRGAQANVGAFSPHDLRRSFVSDLLDAGADVSMVQKLAGHAQPTTTAKYDRRPERSKRKAAELLHVPYVVNAEKAARPQ